MTVQCLGNRNSYLLYLHDTPLCRFRAFSTVCSNNTQIFVFFILSNKIKAPIAKNVKLISFFSFASWNLLLQSKTHSQDWTRKYARIFLGEKHMSIMFINYFGFCWSLCNSPLLAIVIFFCVRPDWEPNASICLTVSMPSTTSPKTTFN